MRKIISEKMLHNMIRHHIKEALKYDKERKQYFPDYTGNPHSDAGKFVSNNRGDFNFNRNDYQWSDPERQKRFQDLQWNNDMEVNNIDPDRENEANADIYLQNQEPDAVVQRVVKELKPELESTLYNLITKAKQKYPLLRDEYYMDDLLRGLADVIHW